MAGTETPKSAFSHPERAVMVMFGDIITLERGQRKRASYSVYKVNDTGKSELRHGTQIVRDRELGN